MGQNAVTMKGLGIQLSVPVFDTWEMATQGREGCVHGGEEGGGGEGGGIFVKIRRSTFVYTLTVKDSLDPSLKELCVL